MYSILVQVYYELGITHLEIGCLPGAIHDFKRAIALCPDFDMAYYKLGVTYSQLGAWHAAKKAFSEALRLDPESTHAKWAMFLTDGLPTSDRNYFGI